MGLANAEAKSWKEMQTLVVDKMSMMQWPLWTGRGTVGAYAVATVAMFCCLASMSFRSSSIKYDFVFFVPLFVTRVQRPAMASKLQIRSSDSGSVYGLLRSDDDITCDGVMMVGLRKTVWLSFSEHLWHGECALGSSVIW